MRNRTCESCYRIIKSREHYFEVRELDNEKELSKKFVHKTCQDAYDLKLKQAVVNNVQVNDESLKFLRNANQMLKSLGGDEVINIA